MLTPSDVLTVQDGASRVSGSVNALNTGGVELNKPELRQNSRAPSQKEKQQLLGLLKVCHSATIMVSFATFIAHSGRKRKALGKRHQHVLHSRGRAK